MMTLWWGALFRSRNRLSGYREHLCGDDFCRPLLFRTRAEARAWINKRYGYIRTRKDLRAEPHGWLFPKAVRVEVKQASAK
jgi:hypothetical protein